MKKGIVLLFLALNIILVSARSEIFTLEKGESFEFRGVNVTLLNINKGEDKALFCVNNVKKIINKYHSFDHSVLDIFWIDKKEVRLELDVKENNQCTGDCLNQECILKTTEKIPTTDFEVISSKTIKEARFDPNQDSNNKKLAWVLIPVVLMLGLMMLLTLPSKKNITK